VIAGRRLNQNRVRAVPLPSEPLSFEEFVLFPQISVDEVRFKKRPHVRRVRGVQLTRSQQSDPSAVDPGHVALDGAHARPPDVQMPNGLFNAYFARPETQGMSSLHYRFHSLSRVERGQFSERERSFATGHSRAAT